MTAVRSTESLKYGFTLAAYFLATVAVGGGAVALGAALAVPSLGLPLGSGSTAERAGGGVLAFLGVVVLLAGLFGLLHKLVADSVAAGTETGSPQPSTGATARPADAVAETGTPVEGGPSPIEADPADAPPAETASADASQADAAPVDTGTQPASGPPEETGVAPEETPRDGAPAAEHSGGTSAEEWFAEPASGAADGATDPAETEPVETGRAGSDAGRATETGRGSERAGGEWEASDTTDPAGDRRERREPTPGEIAFGTDPEEGVDAAEEDDTGGGGDGIRKPGSSASGDPLADPTDEE